MLVLEKLKEIGYKIFLRGEELRLTWTGESNPDPSQVKPLLAELKERKQEAIAYIRSQQDQHDDVIAFAFEAKKVKIKLERAGFAKIRSDTLKEDVYFTNDDTTAGEVKKADSGAVVYALDELRELVRNGMTKERLKQIHGAKKIFNGMIVKNDKNSFTR